MAIGPRSLTERVVLIATLWSTVALVAIALVISALYRQGAERSFNNLLRAQLYNVVNAISIGDGPSLTGSPQLGDLRFSQPGTGWYWIVEPLPGLNAAPLASISLGTSELPIPDPGKVPFDLHYERFYEIDDVEGNHIRIAETEVVIGPNGEAARFRVSGNLMVVDADIARFSQRVYVALAVFGLGGLVLNGLGILYGLRPLDGARRALEKIRAGEAERLEGVFPREVMPLVNEINALIESNRRLVDRARMQVGNLAHSLKTPIAVLLNEARGLDKGPAEVVRGQAEAMQAQVASYLNRARIAAQRNSVLARTEAGPAVERLVRVMRRLNPETEFDTEIDPADTVLAMEQQDVEEILGNLMENAARYARARVAVRIAPVAPQEGAVDQGRKRWSELTIEDDGPGLEPEEIVEALKRGSRLDESKPGTGLGLSIVAEIVAEYQGSFMLTRAALGGLKARMVLPAVASDAPERRV